MTLQTGKLQLRLRNRDKPYHAGFTLIELILVMALLVVVLGYAAPSLSRFFRGRVIDHEARRFLALTRYGQSRAASEGIPVILWIDVAQKVYGLKAQTGYVEEDPLALQYTLDPGLEIELPQSQAVIQTNFWTMAPPVRTGQRVICFLPDGYLSETSPDRILIRQTKDNQTVCISASQSRIGYEIQTNQLQQVAR